MAAKKVGSKPEATPRPAKECKPTGPPIAQKVTSKRLPEPPSKIDGLTAKVETMAGKIDKLGGAMGHFANSVNPIIALVSPVVAKVAKSTQAQPVDAGVVYTPKEVAKLLKVPEKTVLEAISNGNLQATKIGSEFRIIGASVLLFFNLD